LYDTQQQRTVAYQELTNDFYLWTTNQSSTNITPKKTS
jgi:hypothetical protein